MVGEVVAGTGTGLRMLAAAGVAAAQDGTRNNGAVTEAVAAVNLTVLESEAPARAEAVEAVEVAEAVAVLGTALPMSSAVAMGETTLAGAATAATVPVSSLTWR